MERSALLALFLNGLTHASCLFLLASGLTLIFGVLGVLNFAHASLFMAGAYLSWTMMSWFDSFWLALLVVPPAIAVLGAAIEYLLLRRIYRFHVTFQLLLTFGVMLVIKDAVRLIWGLEWRTMNEPGIISGSCSILGTTYPIYNLVYIGFVALVALGLWFFLTRTRYGKIVRAAAQDREMASALGINVPALYTTVFALGAGLAAVMGVFHGPLMNVNLDVDVHYIIQAFAVVVIGGLGSVPGALLGSVLVGLVNAFGIVLMPRFQMAFMYMVMAAVLILRPHGLLGQPGL